MRPTEGFRVAEKQDSTVEMLMLMLSICSSTSPPRYAPDREVVHQSSPGDPSIMAVTEQVGMASRPRYKAQKLMADSQGHGHSTRTPATRPTEKFPTIDFCWPSSEMHHVDLREVFLQIISSAATFCNSFAQACNRRVLMPSWQHIASYRRVVCATSLVLFNSSATAYIANLVRGRSEMQLSHRLLSQLKSQGSPVATSSRSEPNCNEAIA